MGRRFGRIVSYLLVIALVMQDSVMTVSAENGRNNDTGVIISETGVDEEESFLEETVDETGGETTAEETAEKETAVLVGETETEQQETAETEADSEEGTLEESTSEESTPEESVPAEDIAEEIIADEIVSDGADSGEAETDPETGDLIIFGENLVGAKPFADIDINAPTQWEKYNNSVIGMESINDGTSAKIKMNDTPLGANWGTGLKSKNIIFHAGTYEVSFEIVSTVDRAIVADFDERNETQRKKIQLKANTKQEIKYDLISEGDWTQFMFYLGNVDNKNDYGAHDITISNLSIREKIIQLAPGEKPEETPGNIVKNGDFGEQDGNGAWYKEWELNAQNASVKSAQYKVVFEMTGGAGADWTTWLKQVVKLESSENYKIAFDIESSIDRSIIAGFDGSMWLPHKALEAGKKETVEYEVTGSAGGNFVIALGSNLRAVGDNPELNQTLPAHRITISNVRITEIPKELPDTPNDTPYPEITNLKSYGGYTPAMMSPLKDGNFKRRLKEGIWETWQEGWMTEYNVVQYTQPEEEDGLKVYIENTGGGEGNKPWDVQLNQKISLARNTKYVLSFKVYSEKARSINVNIADIGDEGNAWVKPIAIQKGETREVVLNLPNLQQDAIDKKFSIEMGNVAGDVQQNTMIFTDMKIEVNGYSELAELIKDGDFNSGEKGSFTITGGENIDADCSEKYLKAEIKKQCGEEDAVLMSGEMKLLSEQDYEVSFMAGATADRTIKAALVDTKGTVLKEQQIPLTQSTKKYSFTYHVDRDKDTTARLKVSLGGSAEVVCMDNIRCDIKGYPASQEWDTETHDIVLLERKAFPVISEMTADQAIVGKDIVLTFKKNEEYKNAIKSITIDGKEVSADQYAIVDGAVTEDVAVDEYAIILNKSLFSVNGSRQVFRIVVKADWYLDNVVKQTVYRKQQWTSSWLEEFNGTELDMTKWSYQDGTGAEYGNAGWGNNEAQYYTRDNLKVTDGELVITAKKERRGNNDYTSARIWTMEDDQKTPKFSQTYGRVEAKMKLAGGEGYEGIWPAFWMLPVDTSIYGTWPLSGEIDILEARGREPDKADGTVHFGKPWPNNESKGGVFEFSKSENNSDSDINDYHIYAVEWDPGEIRWYVDDELYFTFSNWYSQSADKPGKYKYPAPFDQDFYIILNLAVGGSFDNNYLPDDDLMPVDMKVDYVRVYNSVQSYPELTKEPVLDLDEETDITSVKSELYDREFEQINQLTEGDLKPDVWNLATLSQFGGSAEFKTVTEDGQVFAKITPTALGSAAHSIQLIQNMTLVKGYNYRVSFDARTDGKRKLNMKIGQDGTEGWDTHETFETTLSGAIQHYTYEFQANTTDKHARIEFNLGTGMQPVYIGNITYELIDEIVMEEDGRKQPCDDQNYVYNGSFNIGDLDGLTYWHNDNSDGKVIREGKGYAYTATKGNLYQYGLELLQEDKYKLTFSAHSDTERKINVSLTDITGKKIYKEEAVTVGAAEGEVVIEFTMPKGVSDRDAKICFDFGEGGSKVYLTDIFLARLTYHNIDWEEVNAYPLLNGDFSLGSLYWSGSGDIGLQIMEEADGSHYARVKGGNAANIWDLMLIHGGLELTGKTDYTFAFDVRASKENETLLVTMEDGGYYRHFEKADLPVGKEWKHYEYDLRFTDDLSLALKFQLGGMSEACTLDFRNVSLRAAGAPREPGSVMVDSKYNKLGEDVIFSYSGEKTWADNAIVYVDGEAVENSKIKFEAGKLKLDKSIFKESKRYTVGIRAEGYMAMPEMDIIMYPMDGDRVFNGGFVYGLEGWDQYLLEDYDTISWEDGRAKIHYSGARYDQWGNIVSWAIQFFQDGIPVETGKTYQISFVAHATLDRQIQVMRNQGSEISDYVSITTEPKVYEVQFHSTSDTLKLQFLLSTVGKDGAAITQDDVLNPHDIYLDNICIKEITGNDGSITVDKTELNNLIAECEKLNESDYTPETWKAMPEALKAAKEMAAKADAKQAEVNMAKDNLLTAYLGLRTPLKVDELKKAIEEYEKTQRGHYMKTTWNAFQTALNAAKAVLENGDARQAEVDAAKRDLEEAYNGLTEMSKAVLDAKASLNEVIEQYQDLERGNYTQKSWNAFKAALKTAQDVAENEEENEGRIEVAKENLEKAFASLELNKEPTNKEKLEQLITKYSKVKREGYTKETWDAFQDALQDARDIVRDGEATEADIIQAKDNLEKAYQELEKEGLWATDIAPVTYTGKAIKPAITVYDGNTQLRSGKDYTASYQNNTKVGTAKVTIKGKGNYSGTITKEFEIKAMSLTDPQIAIQDLYVIAPKGKNPKAVVPKPVVTRNGKKLKLKTEYTVECVNKEEGAYILPGTYKVRINAVEGKGYTGSREINITLADAETQKLMSKASVVKIPNQTYNGEKIEPAVTVKMGKTTLIPEQDYTVKYVNNIEIGTAEVIIKGTGTTYLGEKRATFKITGTALKAAKVKLKDVTSKGLAYTGKEIRPQVEIEGLVQDKDYTVEYQKNVNKGTAAVIVKGINAYTGTVKKTFKITAYHIGTNEKQAFKIESENIVVPYAKGKCKPSVTVSFDGRTLQEGTDYTLSYRNNGVAEGTKSPEIAIKGKGNYTGTATTKFTITKQSLEKTTATAADILVKNVKKYHKVNPIVTDLDGKTLKKGTDYTVEEYTYENGEKIDTNNLPKVGDTVRITLKGKGNYQGTCYAYFRVIDNNNSISKATITVKTQTFTGKEIKPAGEAVTVTVKVKNPTTKKTDTLTLEEGKDYEIVKNGYSKNISKGTGKLTIRGIGSYGGTKTGKFKISAKTLSWASWYDKTAEYIKELFR